jgi:primosomal protein N' (replication factor Y) (superfamily II helicase)
MFADLIFPLSAPGVYTYRIKPDQVQSIEIGSRALVEFGKKRCFGFVAGISEKPGACDVKTLKDILEPSPAGPFFAPEYIKFLLWLSEYYLAAPGEVLRTAMPAPLLRYLEKHPVNPKPLAQAPSEWGETSPLTEEQAAVFQTIRERLRGGQHHTVLLQGVTSSGKSHVYYALAREALRAGRGALIMVPEISLTPQTVKNFTDIFRDRVAVFHSGLSDKERIRNWLRIYGGEAPVVVGVRSVLFTPVRNLGLIVVDEEHDSSFCEGDRNFSYNARDAAVVRGSIERAVVVLGSATPSLLSRHNADAGKYTRLTLTRRYNDMPLPKVHRVDMRQERARNNWSIFSGLLQEKMAERFKSGQQVILLKNRRGYAHFLMCQECGEIPTCAQCNISLTYHRAIGRLVCHYCNSRSLPPAVCPKCRGVNLKPAGSGVEKVEEDLKKLFPEARTLRLDLDTGSKRGAVEKILQSFREKKADVLIGTQMVSKGLDFPDVTLVGVVLADTGLFLPDFHAPERTFQLLTQVAGRSGRGEAPGEVVLQTYSPEEGPIALAVEHDYEAFYRQELRNREELGFPPFARGVLVRVLAREEAQAQAVSERFHRGLDKRAGLTVLGPAPMPLYRLRNYYRTFLYLRSPSSSALHQAVAAALSKLGRKLPGGVKIQTVFDPDSLL